MVAQKGRDFLLKVEDTPSSGTFTVVGGLRATAITINNEQIDITNKDSAGSRELLAGAGISAMSISGSGVFDDGEKFQKVRAAAENNTHLNYQITIPGSSNARTYEGPFMVTTLEQSGDHNGEVNWSLSLESAGSITSA